MTETEKLEIEEAIRNANVEITRNKAYLAQTDYMRLREMDGGESMPAEVVNERNDAREKINHYEAMIADLTTTIGKYKPENTPDHEEAN